MNNVITQIERDGTGIYRIKIIRDGETGYLGVGCEYGSAGFWTTRFLFLARREVKNLRKRLIDEHLAQQKSIVEEEHHVCGGRITL